jgi:DNA-binding transcriptional LysR family regulator
LVERRGRGIEPTATGRALAAEAEAVLESLSGIEGFVGDLRAGRVGSLSVRYFPSAGAAWLAPVVGRLVEEFPDLRLELLVDDGTADPRVDLDVYVGPLDGSTPTDRGSDRVVHHLADDPYVAVLPGSHPLAGRRRIDLAQLASDAWVDNDLPDGSCRRLLLDACATAGFTPRFRVETHDYPTAISFVAAGTGVTVLPVLCARNPPPGVSVVRVANPTPVRRIFVAVRATVQQHPAAVRMIQLLRRYVSRPVTPAA